MLYSDLELLSTDQLLHLPPPEWLMEGLIPKEGYVTLYGEPSTGKSFVALDWAMCISEGRSWLGTHKTEQAPVVYVAAEGGRGIQGRVRAWMQHHKYDDLPAMYWLLEPLYIREQGTVEAFLDKLEEHDVWPGLMVLDTLSRSFGGGEENASADMGHFVDQMAILASGRRMACMVVHHTNATGQRERGHTALRGGMDAMFQCVASKDANGHLERVELVNAKQKDAIEADSIWMHPIPVSDSLVFEPCMAPEKKKAGPGEARPISATALKLALRSAEDGLTWGELKIASGLQKDKLNFRLRRLMNNGEIFKENNRYFLYPALEDIADEV